MFNNMLNRKRNVKILSKLKITDIYQFIKLNQSRLVQESETSLKYNSLIQHNIHSSTHHPN